MVRIENLAQEVIKKLEQILEGYTFEYQKVIKNNDITLHGITARPEGSSIAPTVYLDTAYEDYVAGQASIDEIADNLASIIKDAVAKVPAEFDAEQVLNWENVKDKVFFVLINTEANQERLATLPSIEISDLSLIFKVQVERISAEGTKASFTVKDQHLQMWNKTVEDLLEVAKENTPKLYPAELMPLQQMLTAIMGTPMGEAPFPMYVLTNTDKMHGAATILYPNVLDDMMEEYGDLVVIPSSIHEMLIIPKSAMSGQALQLVELIKEVNRTQLKEEEILSDHPYQLTKNSQLEAMA